MLVENRQNLSTVNADSQWLFPGRLAGQPLHFSTLLGHLRADLDLPSQATRAATLRQLVLQAPAPVIADALGFSAHHMNRIWTVAGGELEHLRTRRSHPLITSSEDSDHVNTGAYQYACDLPR
ncbi:hypothetical protein OG874_21460 [Nocardia sp. NBC_00565]|uniref:hypothetical protein n=1 Tax=Nocardia sp. NBC_00565 TaxID=2975993 RepID=UPI002E80400C|nr:hypothetical protein [Nocardia sp. NBC_00565]WUC07495.1 hypothetical protein OG874_21460 [Nocardia sp. NBC_00565]